MANTNYKINIAITSIALTISLIFLTLTSISSTVIADENLTTNVSVGNSAPTVHTITCSPITDGNFTPSVGANETLYCWAIIEDSNGYGDVNQSTLDTNFYDDTLAGGDDLNSHYSNGTGSNAATNCSWTSASGTNITANCSYNIRYFINPSDDGWTIDFNVTDGSGSTGSNATTLGVVTTIGLDVKNSSIEYGNLALGGESERSINITNTCNQQIDVMLRESDISGDGVGYLYCPSSNDLQTNNDTSGIRYNDTSSFTWSEGTALTGTSTQYTGFDLGYYSPTGLTDGESTKNIYWRIKIPLTGISGVCSGQTEFIAIAG